MAAKKRRGRPRKPPSRRVTKFSVSLPKTLVDDLRWCAKEDDVPLSELLRDVLTAYIEDRG